MINAVMNLVITMALGRIFGDLKRVVLPAMLRF